MDNTVDKKCVYEKSSQSTSIKRCFEAPFSDPSTRGGKVEITISTENLYIAQEREILDAFNRLGGRIIDLLCDLNLKHN